MAGIFEGNTYEVHSFLDQNGQEKLYKNGIKKNGERYSFFKLKDSQKNEKGKYIQLPFTYIIYTMNGETLEAGMKVKINKINSISGNFFNQYFQIVINAEVEIQNKDSDDYYEHTQEEYIGVDTYIGDDDLPF